MKNLAVRAFVFIGLSETTGDVERPEEHLDPQTGWLSIDVMNVLGVAQLGLHVDGAPADWNQLQGIENGAAFVNWNKTHWSILQCDPSGEGWMHTISRVASFRAGSFRFTPVLVHSSSQIELSAPKS